ncbi:hypothetical protein BJX70DRAFT_374555 [Aspergillus crustosus]
MNKFLLKDKEWQVAVDVAKLSQRQNHAVLTTFICTNDSWMGSTDSHVVMSHVDMIRDVAREIWIGLEQHLPGYMVPALFIPLSSTSLTTSGKTDRRKPLQREPSPEMDSSFKGSGPRCCASSPLQSVPTIHSSNSEVTQSWR